MLEKQGTHLFIQEDCLLLLCKPVQRSLRDSKWIPRSSTHILLPSWLQVTAVQHRTSASLAAFLLDTPYLFPPTNEPFDSI